MNDQVKEIEKWVIKGDHDLGTAEITYLHIPEYLDTITFHCQQAVEKYLKAYLTFQTTPFKFTHDLIYLLELITREDPDFEKYYDIASELQGYAVEIRYPDETVYLSTEKVEKAIITAKKIREMITKKMTINIDYNEITNR